MPKPETRLRETIVLALRRAGYYVIVNHGSAFSGSGRPDLTVDAAGTCVWIEVKTKSGALTPRQAAEILKIRRCGGNAFVARSPASALRGVNAARQGRLHMVDDTFDIDDFLKSLDATTPTATTETWDDGSGLDFKAPETTEYGPLGSAGPSLQDILNEQAVTSLPSAPEPASDELWSGIPTPHETVGFSSGVALEQAPENFVEKAVAIPRSRRPTGLMERIAYDIEQVQSSIDEVRRIVAKSLILLNAGADLGILATEDTDPDKLMEQLLAGGGDEKPKRRGRPRKVVE